MSVNDWYSSFLANRPVEMKRSVARGKTTSCYSMHISKLFSPQVAANIHYQISAFLFDPMTKQMFGRQCHTEWKKAENGGECTFNESLYFYSIINDRDLLLVIEFIEESADYMMPPKSIGWFYTNVDKRQVAGISEPRITEVLTGTPKMLIFDKEMVQKNMGTVECNYRIHEMPPIFTQCLPEFCIVSSADWIPGIQKDSDDEWWLSTPKEMITIPAALDSIAIQFKNNVPELEKQIMTDIEREWAVKEAGGKSNRPPKAVIMDRKLRIGIHNGYTYVTEPFTVDLEVIDANLGGTLRRGKKPIDFGKSTNWQENIMFQASGNPRLPLRNLYADPRMAIIFLLEYSFHREDNQSLNQTILIGWAAWTPFSDGMFSGKAVETRVSIVGGPRPSPEGVLCYKNVLNQPDSVRPLSEKLEIFVDFKFFENGRSVHNTPTPRRSGTGNYLDSSRKHTARDSETASKSSRRTVTYDVSKKDDEEEEDPLTSSRFPPIVNTGRSISSVDELRQLNKELDEFIEEPVESPVLQMQVKKPIEEPRPLTSIYKIPFEEMKPTNFPRSVHSLFAREKFVPLMDRNGKSAITEDATQKTIVDMAKEQFDRLDVSHVYFQFVAFKQLASSESVPSRKVFFTINFFRFPELNTESMLLTNMEKSEPSLLTRLDSHGQKDEVPGFIAKYIIEGEEEKLDFLDFMLNGHACIDIWDSDSLIHIGSTMVPMRNLYRRGREAVQMFMQCPVVETSLESGQKASAFLYLRVVNVGLPSVNLYDPSASSMSARGSTTANNSHLGTVVRRLTSSIRLNEEGPHTYRVHAKPLSGDSGGGLDKFLIAQRLDIQQRHEQVFNEQSLGKLRQWNDVKKSFEMLDDRAIAQKFIFEEELAAYKKLRYESKPAKLLEAVFKGITTCHRIKPAFGEKIFFEFPLENPRSEPINCTIEYDDEALRLLFDEEEWKFFKTIHKLSTPLERNMMRQAADRIELFLQPGETVYVPFVYDSFYFPSDHFTMYSTKIVFRRWDNQEPLAILDLHVHRRSFLIQHAVTFIAETSGNWEKQIVLPPMARDRRVLSSRCSDPSVRMSIRNATLNQLVCFSTYSGETNDRKTFLLLMYSDHYQTRLISTWKITILPFFNVEVRSIVGQTTRLHLLVNRKSEHDGVPDDLLNVYTGSTCMKVVDAVLAERTPTATIDFTPNFVGTKKFVVSVVNSNTNKLERGFLVFGKSEAPRVTQKFSIQIPASDEAVKRKIPIRNPYGMPKTFRITTSHPEIVKISDPIMAIPPMGKLPCEVYFVRQTHHQQNSETLLYISDAETYVQEEAYSLSLAFEAF